MSQEQAAKQVFVGDSEMAVLMRSYDWAQTPLGAIETWSEDLKTVVERRLTELNQTQTAQGQQISIPSQNGTQTALRQTAAADVFRVTLSEALRLLTDANEIQATAARILGESLKASRVIYVEVLPGGDEVIVHKNYANGVAELSGQYRLKDFGRNLTEDHRAGRSAIVPDVANSFKYSESEKAGYQAIDIAAHLDVPLIKNERFVALLAVHQATPREWTEFEVRQVEEAAERTWAAVERARAEAALRESEARLRLALKTGKLGSWQLDLKTNHLFASDQCKVNYGFLPEADFTHQALFDRIYLDDRAWVQAAIEQAIEQQTDYDVEYRTVWDDGSLHWALVRGCTVYDGDGTPLHMVGMSLDITDLKQAETLLRASHDTFRYLVENSPFGVYTVDADFRLAQVSAGAQKVFETVRPLSGRDFAEVLRVLWPEPFASEAIARFRHTLETGEPYHAPSTIERRHDIGEVESYDWKLEQITLPDGRFGVVCHFYDLSERQRYEAALRDSEERFRHMADNAPVMIWVTDPTGYCTYLSQSWYNFTGQTEETGLGFGWLSRVHPDDREISERVFLDANQRHEAFSLEYRLQNQQGEYIWTIDAATPRFGVAGQFQGYIGSVLDITERKRVEDERTQAEAALREGKNRLRLALESAELGTWDFNPLTGLLQWDDQCKAMFGLSPEAEINYDLFLAGLHPEDRDRTDRVVQFSLDPESGGEYNIEYRTIGIKDGAERWIAAKRKAFFNPAGIAIRFIGTVLNMTEKKQAEAEREQLLQREQTAREAAETANRIKDEFLAVLSHELRTPLNPILGWSKLLQQGKLDGEKTVTALATIERNAKLQAQLIEDLLDISRILQGKLTLNIFPVHLSFVISAALETVRSAIDAKAIQLTLAIDPAVGQILGDAARLQQVVWNLLSNAAKFTPANGQVTIALNSTNSHAQIQISDTGKGIKPEFLPYIFEHFRQEDGATTRKFGGLGLGLAIARRIVELHGGTITVDSPGEGKGATFTVQIPLAERPNVLPATNLPSSAIEDLSGIRILVVDDEADSREFVAFVLEQAGAIVTTVSSGIEALQVFSQAAPDIVVSDIGMPEMDGYMLIRQIRARSEGKQIPAIALTAYAGELNQQQAVAAGFQRHLSKPVEPEEVVKAVRALWNEETANC